MPDHDAVEDGLIADLIADATIFDANNLIAGGHDEVVDWLLSSTERIYGGYTLLAGGDKGTTPHTWTWHIRLVFLVKVASDVISDGQTALKTLLAEIDLDEWRTRSKLGGAALRSTVRGFSEPTVVSYNRIPFYRVEVLVDADVRYRGVVV